MNEELRHLESELSSFQPAPTSPELRERVAEALSSQIDAAPAARGDRQRLRYMVWMAVAASVLLAVGLIAYQQFGNRDHESPKPAPRRIAQDNGDSRDDVVPQPSLWAYRVAMADSPQRLDAMLDQHAATLLSPEEDLIRAGFAVP